MAEKVSEPFTELAQQIYTFPDQIPEGRKFLESILTPRLERAARREAFEECARELLLCDPTGDLKTQAAYFAWIGWQAAHKSVREELEK